MAESNKQTVVEYGQLLNNLREQFLKNYREEFAQLVKYGETLMGTLAVIAGFGFTAFQFINSLILFFTGEILVVFSILYLIYNIRVYIAGQSIETETWLNNSVRKMRDIKKSIIEDSQTDLKRLADEFRDDVNDISKEVPLFVVSKNISNNLQNSFWIGTVGIGLIFTSFFVCF